MTRAPQWSKSTTYAFCKPGWSGVEVDLQLNGVDPLLLTSMQQKVYSRLLARFSSQTLRLPKIWKLFFAKRKNGKSRLAASFLNLRFQTIQVLIENAKFFWRFFQKIVKPVWSSKIVDLDKFDAENRDFQTSTAWDYDRHPRLAISLYAFSDAKSCHF